MRVHRIPIITAMLVLLIAGVAPAPSFAAGRSPSLVAAPSPAPPAQRSLGDIATVRGAAGHPLEMTLYGVYWARTADKDVCPCAQPVAGAVAVRILATKAPDTLPRAGFSGVQGGHAYPEASATQVPWAGCDEQDRDIGRYEVGVPRLVLVDLEVPAAGGELAYTDSHGKQTRWRLTGAAAGTGFANARRYDVAYC